MEVIEVKKQGINIKEFTRRSALNSDCARFIDFDCLITEDGVPKILYKKIETDTSLIRNACRKIQFAKNIRTTGLKTESRIFGYSPRNTIRKDFCSATSLAYEKPAINSIICNFGQDIAKLYAQYFPDVYKMHDEIASEKISESWRMNDTPFTSGIVNKNNPLKYHFDAGNIKNVLSNMIVFKKDIDGGNLACPEYNITLECADNTCVLFDGQSILHGVTPIIRKSESAYRYSVVYYTLQQMWNCLTVDEELIRIRKLHLKREYNRANEGVTKDMLQFDKGR